jgi:2-isopropylmalate synthase
VRVIDYHEHALGEGAGATAVAYVEIAVGNGTHAFGVGRDPNLITASLRAVLGAVRRGQQQRGRIVTAAAERVAGTHESHAAGEIVREVV